MASFVQFPDVSIVLTTWNNARSIRKCLDNLLRIECLGIHLGDCGSTDETLEIVKRGYGQVTILSSGADTSFAEARNRGLAAAAGEYVLFIEGDWLLDSASIDRLRDRLQSDSSLAIAVPQLRDQSGAIQVGHSVRRFPTAAALAMEFLLFHKLLRNDPITRSYRMIDFSHEEDRIVDHGCGAVALSKRAVLLAASGYDPEYAPAWMEDVDLSRRLADFGYKTVFCATATARHMGRETTRHFLIEHRYDDFYRSVLRYSAQYLGGSWQAVRICLIAGLLGKLTFSYLLPAPLRKKILRSYDIYNSDEAIQSYKRMYLRALVVALRGERHVPSRKPLKTAKRLPGRPPRPQRKALSPHR